MPNGTAPALDPLDADAVYQRHLETCALLNVPLSRKRARELFEWWGAFENDVCFGSMTDSR